MLEIGSLIDGKYKILNEIGHGGMSVVYLAMVERANQTWAIKEVRKNGATKEDIVQQGLVAEMNILKRLNHSHLPRIIDIIDHDDSFLIVMDFIEGVDLDKKLQREGPQRWEDVIEWGKQLCDVFAYLHSRTPPIIYRDMKPGNVKLKPDGNVVLFDFGTAREYKSQKAGDDTTCLGTRGYASPEQYGGMGQTDARSDIYCLGATLYHLVTGVIPSGKETNYQYVPIRAMRPDFPKTGKENQCVRGLEYIITKCMQQNPADRYQNCAELMYDLENPDKITPDVVRQMTKRRNRWFVCAAMTLVCVALGIVFNVLASKTTTVKYTELMTDALKGRSGYSDSTLLDYKEAERGLKEAIKYYPSSESAWLYLAKLYCADYQVTSAEYNSMRELYSMYSDALADGDGVEKFCFEWGQDLFFFETNSASYDSKAGVGDYTGNSAIFLESVLDENNPEAYKNLINKNKDPLGKDVSMSLEIKSISENEAISRYQLAEKLCSIALGMSSLTSNKGTLTTDGYTYSNYLDGLYDLLTFSDSIGEGSSNIATPKIKASIYLIVVNSINRYEQDFVSKIGGNTSSRIAGMVEDVNKKVTALENSSSAEILETLKDVFDSITYQCEKYKTAHNQGGKTK